MNRTPLAAFATALLFATSAPAGNSVGIEELALVHEGIALTVKPQDQPPAFFAHEPGRPWVGVDLLFAPSTPDPTAIEGIYSYDHDLGITVQTLADDSRLRASFFHAGAGAPPTPSQALRERQTLAVLPPVAERNIALDPSDPSGNTVYVLDSLLGPDGFVHGFATTFFKSVGGLGYETEVVDYREGGAGARATPISFAPASEPLAAAFTADPQGRVFGVFASPEEIGLFDMIDPQGQIVASPLASTAPPAGFDPASVQLGIIAILIGLVETPVPSISFQAGDELFLYAYDGAGGFDPIAQQPIPAGTRGLMEEEGISYFFLDGTSNTIFRGAVGSPPDTRIGLADVAETLDSATPPASPSSFESADGDALLDIGSDWTPPGGVTRSAVAAASDALLRSVADQDLVFAADGRRGAVLRGVLPGQQVAGSYESSGALARSFVLDVEQMPFGDVFDPAVDAGVIELVNADVATAAPFVFDDTDGVESITVLGYINNQELWDWRKIRAASYRAEVVPWLWLLPGADASIEQAEGTAGPRALDAGIHESDEEQTALAVTPTSFVAATNDAADEDVQAFAAAAAAALGGPVEVLAYASAVSRTETVDKDETITIHANRSEATLGEDLYLFWGDGLAGTGVIDVTIELANDETQWAGVVRQHHGSVATLGAALAGTSEPLLGDEVWNQASVSFEGDPDQPLVLGVVGVGIVRLVPEPGATAAGAAMLTGLLARRRRSN